MSLSITCPACGRRFTVDYPGFDGYFQFPCPGGHFVAVRLPLGKPEAMREAAPASGTWFVRVGDTEPVPLADGTYVIGRKDAKYPSQLSTPESDKKASRQCATLTIKGSAASMTVNKTTNPVVIDNSRQVSAGATFSIGNGTKVRIGNTPLSFDYR